MDRRDIYLLKGGVRHKITDLTTLARFHDRERFEVNAEDIAQYTVGSPVPSITTTLTAIQKTKHRAGTLLRVDRSAIYVVRNGTLVRIPNPQALRAYRGQRILEISSTSLLP